jgi:hypothetical protein
MTIETLTINDLRAKTTNTVDIYYTTDIGQEGEWYYDAADITSIDNIGTILVSSSGMRFKRVYEKGFVNATWFGAKGDGLNDDTDAIQDALNFISDTSYAAVSNVSSGGGTVFLPKGKYIISKSLIIGQHCSLLGVAKSATYHNDNTSGSVIIVNPNRYQNFNIWAIQSATYIPFSSHNLINYNSFYDDQGILNPIPPPPYLDLTHTHATVIEQITIYCNEIYGGIKLTNSPYSEINSVSVFAANIGIYLNNCWNCSIENSFVRRVNWYGIVLAETNVCSIINCAISGKNEDQSNSEKYLIPETELPLFVTKCDFKNLDDKARRGRTGIFVCMNGNANQIINCSSEVFTNGIITLSNSNLAISTAYIEDIIYYGIITASGVLLTQINTVYFERIGKAPYTPIDIANSYPFYFGEDTSAQIATVSCRTIQRNVGKLFKIETDLAYITFANTQYADRTYHKQVLFIDETTNGANLGAIYIDPINGKDFNYGFNKNDAVQTFDAALIRVQNQSTINPIKTIFIKATEEVPLEGGNAQIGAAIKNLDIVSIQNADLLITSYDVTGTKPKGRIFFIGDSSGQQLAMVGQIELLQNSNLYFSNIDIYTNNALLMSSNPVNLSLFGLKSSYAKVTFESIYSPILPSPFSEANIYINFCYFLFQASNSIINTNRKDSLLEVKFINIVLSSNPSFAVTLSPDIPFASAILGVDCVQISSLLPIPNYSLPNRGWNNAIIIRNNF